MSVLLSSIFFIVWLLFGFGGIIRLIVNLCIYAFLAHLLCNINPEETYSWYSGIWHGIFFIPNYMFHDISADALYKANFYTTAYNIWWWICTIVSSVSFLSGGGLSNR